MRRGVPVILLVAAMMICSNLYAAQYAYIVRFTDKNNTSYSLSTPLSYLSSRSLARRTTQGLFVDSTDLPVNSAYIDSVITLTGGVLHGSSHWFNFCVVLVSDSTFIHVLDDKPYVSSTKFIAFYPGTLHLRTPKQTSPNNTTKKTTADPAYYNSTWQQTALVNGQHLHDDGFTGNGKLIAVFDAGFIDSDTHPGFSAMWTGGRMVDKHNFTLASDFIFGYDNHGSKALSQMAGYVPNTFVGSAPMASYALYVTEDGNSEQPIEMVNMLFALERADSIGTDVVSTSLGYNGFDNPADNLSFTVDLDGKSTIAAQGANMATKKGMLCVITAGNEGGTGWNKILTPGDADSALTIGSVDNTGIVAPNSGYGPNAAGRIKPDVCGMGQAAAIFNGTGYGMQSGTSFATPQIAGWATCVWQAFPTATPYQIRQAIIKCATLYATPSDHMGYGVPDFQCAKQMLLNVIDLPTPFDPAKWLTATPNPFDRDLTLVVSPDTEQIVDISIMDVTGKIVVTTSRYFNKGYNTPLTISLAGLPAGVYVLKAVSPKRQFIQKLVKK